MLLKHRCCNGDCAYESFVLPKIADGQARKDEEFPETNGLALDYIKTGFRLYDIAVTAALLIAKRHLRSRMVIHSNGSDAQWADARELCQKYLGYGTWFGIVEDPDIEVWESPDGNKVQREVRIRLLIEMDVDSMR